MMQKLTTVPEFICGSPADYPVFLPFPGADRSFHSPGRFQNTAESKLLWPDTEYDP